MPHWETGCWLGVGVVRLTSITLIRRMIIAIPFTGPIGVFNTVGEGEMVAVRGKDDTSFPAC
jgi:hypothetical protein